MIQRHQGMTAYYPEESDVNVSEEPDTEPRNILDIFDYDKTVYVDAEVLTRIKDRKGVSTCTPFINHLKMAANNGHKIVVWSDISEGYAKELVKDAELQNYVYDCVNMPDVIVRADRDNTNPYECELSDEKSFSSLFVDGVL